MKKKINLLDPIDRRWIEKGIGTAKVLIIDNYGSMVPLHAESNPDKWRENFVWMRTLCDTLGITIILVHHANKNGEMRGTGKMLDDCDLVISLTKPEGCSDQETKILVQFPNARHIHGKQREPFMLDYVTENMVFSRYIYNADGTELSHEWIVSESEKQQYHLTE